MEVREMEDIYVAIIASVGGLLGSLLGFYGNNKLISYRIDLLDKKVEKHNNVIERTYKLEERTEIQEEKIKVANHRIDDLERTCVE
jgi:hypothetical protein